LTYGYRSVSGEPITPEVSVSSSCDYTYETQTHFAIASNSKLFLSTILVWLSQKNITLDNGNVWELDTPLKDFVPDFKMVNENATRLATTNDFLGPSTCLSRF
jgi:CubicO group peptidase (beta-lactamase class C family)